jgi:GNAT superfamily N-acetyltransferase
MLTEEMKRYIADPCKALSTAYWKKDAFPIPAGIRIEHADNSEHDIANSTAYFRMVHYPHGEYETTLPSVYEYADVHMPDQAEMVADLLNRCYLDSSFTPQEIVNWMSYPVYKSDLWIFIVDAEKKAPVELGIADFDMIISEGSLEWIQVLPEYQRKGLGQAVVNELLRRMSNYARFVTVSGQIDNPNNPRELYRKCGFTGDDIWIVSKNSQ